MKILRRETVHSQYPCLHRDIHCAQYLKNIYFIIKLYNSVTGQATQGTAKDSGSYWICHSATGKLLTERLVKNVSNQKRSSPGN